MSWRLDGSAIFTFSLVSYPNPKIIDFGSSFGSLLGAFWHLLDLLGASWGSLGLPRGAFLDNVFLIDFVMPF